MKIGRLFLLVAFGVLGACSTGDASAERDEPPQQKTFTAEDKRVALTLSIGNNEISSSVSPQYRATLCSLALELIADRLNTTLSSGERQAFAQAQALYDQRATAGTSQDEQERTLGEVEAAYPNQADKARFAIGCLRDLT